MLILRFMAMVSVTGMRKFVVGFLWRSDFACAWAYAVRKESFSLAFPALVLQRALRASGPCRAIIGRPAEAGLDRGVSMQRLPLRRL